MATQMQLARQGIITEAMRQVAAQEDLAPEFIREGVAAGTIAICCNSRHKNLVPRGVGQGLSVKVNAILVLPALIQTRSRNLPSCVPLRSWCRCGDGSFDRG